jgi:hypothetical protein
VAYSEHDRVSVGRRVAIVGDSVRDARGVRRDERPCGAEQTGTVVADADCRDAQGLASGASRCNDRLDYAVEMGEIARGRLNPQWVEWLMGFPAEWTALNRSATPSSRKSRKSSAG